MTIKSINEIPNKEFPEFKVIKERMDINVPGIENENVSRRNGMVYCLTGSGGSGKTNLLLNMVKNKKLYKGKYHNIFYFSPSSSFLSIEKHPFENHDKVYHELTVSKLQEIYNELVQYKEVSLEKKEDKPKGCFDGEDEESDDEEPEIKYSLIIIDDFASNLKDVDIVTQLSKMMIKARHICCSFIFTLQSFFYFPKILRKQITYITIYKSKNVEEFNTIANELLAYNKEDALKLFNFVFDAPYNHLDIDTVSDLIYKNFNKLEITN